MRQLQEAPVQQHAPSKQASKAYHPAAAYDASPLTHGDGHSASDGPAPAVYDGAGEGVWAVVVVGGLVHKGACGLDVQGAVGRRGAPLQRQGVAVGVGGAGQQALRSGHAEPGVLVDGEGQVGRNRGGVDGDCVQGCW